MGPIFMLRKLCCTLLFLTGCCSFLYASPPVYYSSIQVLKDTRISGHVVDDQGKSLPGVSVKIKGTTYGTVTDAEGNYSINVPADGVVIFSFTGFVTKEVKVGAESRVNVQLATDSKLLNSVVVIGYGTTSKKAVTGSVASVGYDKFKDRSYSNVTQSLAGQVAGVNITQGQGAPGVAPIIRVRGISSITAGTNPLFVVDGVPLENFNLNNINPQDIASVEVLKDASSAAIYGSRGANGVVIVTTKLGKVGKTDVSFSYEYGVQQLGRKIKMMDAQQWIRYYIAAKNNAWTDLGGNRSAADPNSARPALYQIPEEFINSPQQFGKGTDWQDVMFRSAPMQTGQLSVSGGTEKTQYLFSASYLDQTAILDANYYKRLALRTNIKTAITDKFTVGLNVSFTGIQDRTDGTQGKSDVISLALQSDPIFSLYNSNGTLGLVDPNAKEYRYLQYNPVNLWHPYATTRYTDKKNRAYNTLAIGYAEYKILDNLKFRTSINGNLGTNFYDYYLIGNQGYGFNQNLTPSTATASSGSSFNWLTENTLNYDLKLGDHSLNVLAGYTVQKQRDDFLSATAANFPNDLIHTLNAGTVNGGTSTLSEWSMISYLARVNYNYKNKYFLTSTIRRDGSSRFGENNKWGYFPSVSGSWIVSDESFMTNLKPVSLFKVRASYGMTGNNQIPNYGSASLLGGINYVNNTTIIPGLTTLNINNKDLKWEKTSQLNVGFDLGFLNNRINLSADFYKSITKDMLLNVPVPDVTGFATQLTNIGRMQNSGIELNINTKNLTGNFKWSTDFNFSHNKNKVLQLGPNNAPLIFTDNETFVKTEVGQPISNFYGYKMDGIYRNQAQINGSVHEASTVPGDPIIVDVNGDGKITADDRTTIGNYQPKFTAGIVNTLSYSGFELSFMFQGSYGGKIVNQDYRFLGFWNSGRNLFASSNDFYVSEANPGDGKNPRPSMNRKAFQQAFSTLWVEDASYLRVKNINISYSLPERWLKGKFIRTARIYANADNVYLFSKYTGYDPENTTFTATSYAANGTAANTGTASSGTPPGAMIGLDYGSYPVPRVITFGIRAGF